MVTDRAGEASAEGISAGEVLGGGCGEGRDERKDGAPVPGSGKLPSEVRPRHDWRTRPDPFEKVWAEVRSHLEREPRLEARTLFDALQRQFPGSSPTGSCGRFSDG